MGVQVVLVVLLMFAGTVEAEEADNEKAGEIVTFSGVEVTLICPEEGDWYKTDTLVEKGVKKYTFKYDSKGKYYCDYGPTSTDGKRTKRYRFYVEARICEGCFELTGIQFGVAIISDLTFTSVLMIVIYRCTKKKNPAAPSHSAPKAPARPGARAPPVPSVDYEPLNLNTRSQDTYSMVNRTG